ncbi:helix-turn-helix domain-containing protein [Catenibacterium sp.]|uniref:helix-turn-helix domain-containing protein n=1 Tax=Catenibacterium sp. TaxID=2049022 RepID=UPI002E78A7F9|nr:hypothetical protein [Catenibacterium sp.]MEE0821297.1 hypothetical protein [Catenibacterium sp.]
MCRVRTIRETANIIKDMDPKTQLTEKTIRKMVSEGTIPSFKTGNKYLINVDKLIEMFETPITDHPRGEL